MTNRTAPSSPSKPVPDDGRLQAEWQGVINGIPADVRQAVENVVAEKRDELVRRYADYLERDPETAVFMATAASRERVLARLQEWLADLFDGAAGPLEARIASQRQIGEALARMNYPIRSAVRGARRMKAWIIAALEDRQLTERALLQAAAYVSNVIDMSVELRSSVYLREVTTQSRIDEAYRLHALGQNIAMERERQRAALMEWGHRVLVEFHRAPTALPRLAQSDFGLWLRHKTAPLFDGDAAIQVMADAVDRVDQSLLPLLEAVAQQAGGSASDLVQQLQGEVDAIRFSLGELFERHIEVENGRDSLTRMLSRRFLPSVLTREIALHRRSGKGSFAVLLVDLDHFKLVNDRHGHDAGDLVLQQAAAAIAASVRPSDFVFRYGGEEFAVVLVESDAEVAHRVAEKVRRRLEQADVAAANGVTLRVTASVGVAAFGGMPDYQVLLKAADDALYRAKAAGRNCVVGA